MFVTFGNLRPPESRNRLGRPDVCHLRNSVQHRTAWKQL
uniref:Uncharacterized protein n=1 Tax=Anguilla anguilla TaxID=7936 RepID=A0A0E9XL05_ANGAN